MSIIYSYIEYIYILCVFQKMGVYADGQDMSYMMFLHISLIA